MIGHLHVGIVWEKIAVLIPCFNEALTIEKVVHDFTKALPTAQIYVYDNNSTDNTAELAADAEAIVRVEPRQGKGFAVRQMFFDIDADLYLMVDGDDTYPAEAAPKLLAPLRDGVADMTIGDRLTNGTYTEENKRPFHNLGNNLVKNSINLLYHSGIQDVMTGYRGFSRVFVESLPVTSDGFQIETEFTIHAVDKRFRLVEIPIDYRDRPEGSNSKLNTFSDGLKVLATILRMFRDSKPMLFFGILAAILFVIGLAIGVPVISEFVETGYITKMPSAVLATGVMMFCLMILITGIILDTFVRSERKNFELNLHRIYDEERKRRALSSQVRNQANEGE